MFSIRALFSALATLTAVATVIADAHWISSPEAGVAGYCTLQVAAFPDEALTEPFVSRLVRLGEKPIWGSVDLGSRGRWIRVFIGTFATSASARQHGRRLVARGIIKEFLVRPASDIRALGRPRTTLRYNGTLMSYGTQNISSFPRIPSILGAATVKRSDETVQSLPMAAGVMLAVGTSIDATKVPRLGAVDATMARIAGCGETAPRLNGGLWISGDVVEGLARLRWIAGARNAEILVAGEEGRVELDIVALAKAAGTTPANGTAVSLLVSDYLYSNEGLLLLTQLIEGPHRYLLHMGRTTMTLGGEVQVEGSINLDNNFDSRINPYRSGRQKLHRERPPDGFEALIAINPSARWFNLRTRKEVPSGNITFHELAEAHAKIALGFEYLQKDSWPGAHSVAIEREMILKSQRPAEESVVTAGSNRVFRSDEEIRKFKAELDGQD